MRSLNLTWTRNELSKLGLVSQFFYCGALAKAEFSATLTPLYRFDIFIDP
jgi:hypothetical protein